VGRYIERFFANMSANLTMRLTKEAITKFQAIYREEFGKEISREEAQRMGSDLLRLIDLIYRDKKEPP